MKFLFKHIALIFSNWINSFSNEPGGFSARKEASFGGFVISVIITLKFTTTENLESILTLWLLFALLCLGIITMQQVAELKRGSSQKTETTTSTTTSEKTTAPNEPV